MHAQPISDDELDTLSRLLHALDAAPLEWVDGYFSALIVGPVLVPMGEYLPAIWGEHGMPEGLDETQVGEAMRLLLRLWEHIVWRIDQPIPEADNDDGAMAGFELLPFFALPAVDDDAGADDSDGAPKAAADGEQEDEEADVEFEGFPFGAAWAIGFLSAQELRADPWAAFLQRNPDLQDDMLQVLRLAAVDADDQQRLGLDDQPLLDFKTRVEATAWLPQMLEQMNLQRQQDERPETIRRPSPKTGRNEACPCGSGRKFKKCCGSGDRALH